MRHLVKQHPMARTWRARAVAPLVAIGFIGWVALPALAAAPDGFAELVEKVGPVVVNVAAHIKAAPVTDDSLTAKKSTPSSPASRLDELLRSFTLPEDDGAQDPNGPGESVGSGFIVDKAGYVVTSEHVIRGADRVRIRLADGRKFYARIIGSDDETDLALLKVDTKDALPVATWADSDHVRVGDWVLAVGNPFGFAGSVTAGIISGRARDIQSGRFNDYLQIDAPMNRGNSGGPAVDREGRVIGVNTAIYSPTGANVGVGFAVPSNTARTVIAELRAHGRVDRGWLGANVQAITPEIADGLDLETDAGALIVEIMPGGPAAKAGLRLGDAIRTVDGKKIEELGDLRRFIAPLAPGRTALLTIWRDGRSVSVPVVLGRTPGRAEIAKLFATSPLSRQVAFTTVVGLVLAPIDRDTRQRFGIADGERGAYVADVGPDTPAAEAGFAEGDIIVSVGSMMIGEPHDVVDALRHAGETGRKALLLLVRRDGHQLYLAIPLPRA
jgi:serine protease Do